MREDDDVPERDDRQSLVEFHVNANAMLMLNRLRIGVDWRRLLDQRDRLFLVRHDLAGDDALRTFFWPGSVYIRSSIRSSMIIRRPRAPILRARASSAIASSESSVNLQLHVLVLEQLLVLTRDRVARLRENLDQRRLVELVQRADDREAADEFGNQAVADQVFRLDLLERRADLAAAPATSRRRLKPSVFLPVRRSICFVEADERAAADEEDVGRVDLEELLVRVLAAALRRDVGDRAFEDLQQRLLHAFTRDVAGDRRVLVLAADLVDFVDVDDAPAGTSRCRRRPPAAA